MKSARWYEAMGGDGLEVRSADSDEWSIYGIVRKNRGCYDAILDRQEDSFSLGLFRTKQEAMDYLLKRSGATLDLEATMKEVGE